MAAAVGLLGAVAAHAIPAAATDDAELECVPAPMLESCVYRTTLVVAVGQTRLVAPSFFDEANRPAQSPDNLEWRFGPTSIGSVLPVFGSASAEIRGDAVGTGTLQLIDLSTGSVLATADVCVFTPGSGTDAVRAELDME